MSGDLIPEALTWIDIRPGTVTDDEFRELFGRCSAVLLPYLAISQSGILATAFQAGRPVIASAVGSFPDHVEEGQNGLLVPPGDPAALAEAIKRLRCEPALASRLAQGARGSWEGELSPQQAAARILRALAEEA
jgi:glycosyltransferase involved in cell wall biosynthesis